MNEVIKGGSFLVQVQVAIDFMPTDNGIIIFFGTTLFKKIQCLSDLLRKLTSLTFS